MSRSDALAFSQRIYRLPRLAMDQTPPLSGGGVMTISDRADVAKIERPQRQLHRTLPPPPPRAHGVVPGGAASLRELACRAPRCRRRAALVCGGGFPPLPRLRPVLPRFRAGAVRCVWLHVLAGVQLPTKRILSLVLRCKTHARQRGLPRRPRLSPYRDAPSGRRDPEPRRRVSHWITESSQPNPRCTESPQQSRGGCCVPAPDA